MNELQFQEISNFLSEISSVWVVPKNLKIAVQCLCKKYFNVGSLLTIWCFYCNLTAFKLLVANNTSTMLPKSPENDLKLSIAVMRSEKSAQYHDNFNSAAAASERKKICSSPSSAMDALSLNANSAGTNFFWW